MNCSIEKPTKIIAINTLFGSTLEPISENDSESSIMKQDNKRIKHSQISHSSVNCIQEDTDLSKLQPFANKESSKLDFYEISTDHHNSNLNFENHLLFQEVCELMKQKLIIREKLNGVSELTFEFLINSIKNDIRIREFRKTENELIIYFYTVDESISFYLQYFKFIQMSFKQDSEMTIFSNIIPIAKLKKPKDYIYNAYRFAESEEDSIFEEMKPLIKNCLEPQTQDEFESRVSYYNKMKNIYSKNEIKKITSLIEDGNLDFIVINIKELCVGSASNLLIQSMLKELSEENLLKIIKAIGSDIAAISSTKYGAYSIQTLIMSCYSKATQNLLVECFGNQGKFLLCHEIGNYAIQRILLFNEDYIYKLFKENLSATIKDELGFKVFKRCLPHLHANLESIKEELKKLDTEESKELLLDIN